MGWIQNPEWPVHCACCCWSERSKIDSWTNRRRIQVHQRVFCKTQLHRFCMERGWEISGTTWWLEKMCFQKVFGNVFLLVYWITLAEFQFSRKFYKIIWLILNLKYLFIHCFFYESNPVSYYQDLQNGAPGWNFDSLEPTLLRTWQFLTTNS